MSNLPKYKVWDNEMLHDVCELHWVQGGIKWYGPGVGEGWVYLNPDFEWESRETPSVDELLEVVTDFDYNLI